PRPTHRTPRNWDKIYWEGKRLYLNLLDIEVPIIGVANGPAFVHAGLVLLSGIVLASDTAKFRDGHFAGDVVPGDGGQILWPVLVGENRGRYFLLTGQELSAAEALNLGVVSEVMGHEQLLPRAREIARRVARKSDLTLRYSRVALTRRLRQHYQDALGYGLMA